jgi:N-terminal domain of anti-restriction factor ArdC
MDTKVTNDDRLAAAHATLTEAVARVATSEDWQQLLHISGSFHRYSPNNQLLLAAQGAHGLVASFHTWKQLPATDGRPCQIRKGETALRVYAPIRTKRQELDEDTGQTPEPAVVGYKLVPVFHQGQLVAPPDLPAQPKLLHGDDPPRMVWEAVAEQINTAGFALRRGPLDGLDGAKGVTNFIQRTVTVRDDLAPAQALKTQIHELGHVLMHYAEVREPSTTRDRIEVEAESVAYVVCDLLGVDAGSYSIPYVANWAGADVELVEATAHKVLTTARQIITGLEAELGVDLRPNPIAAGLSAGPETPVEPATRTLVTAGTTDRIPRPPRSRAARLARPRRLDPRPRVPSLPALQPRPRRPGDRPCRSRRLPRSQRCGHALARTRRHHHRRPAHRYRARRTRSPLHPLRQRRREASHP